MLRSQNLSNSVSGNQVFGVFGGGWSSIRYDVSYSEYYRSLGGNNDFFKRITTVVYTSSGATSKPYIVLNGVKHSNSNYQKVFSDWNNISIMYNGEWENGYGRENTESVVYPSNTGILGKQPFLLVCDGGTPGIVPNSVELSLQTY